MRVGAVLVFAAALSGALRVPVADTDALSTEDWRWVFGALSPTPECLSALARLLAGAPVRVRGAYAAQAGQLPPAHAGALARFASAYGTGVAGLLLPHGLVARQGALRRLADAGSLVLPRRVFLDAHVPVDATGATLTDALHALASVASFRGGARVYSWLALAVRDAELSDLGNANAAALHCALGGRWTLLVLVLPEVKRVFLPAAAAEIYAAALTDQERYIAAVLSPKRGLPYADISHVSSDSNILAAVARERAQEKKAPGAVEGSVSEERVTPARGRPGRRQSETKEPPKAPKSLRSASGDAGGSRIGRILPGGSRSGSITRSVMRLVSGRGGARRAASLSTTPADSSDESDSSSSDTVSRRSDTPSRHSDVIFEADEEGDSAPKRRSTHSADKAQERASLGLFLEDPLTSLLGGDEDVGLRETASDVARTTSGPLDLAAHVAASREQRRAARRIERFAGPFASAKPPSLPRSVPMAAQPAINPQKEQPAPKEQPAQRDAQAPGLLRGLRRLSIGTGSRSSSSDEGRYAQLRDSGSDTDDARADRESVSDARSSQRDAPERTLLPSTAAPPPGSVLHMPALSSLALGLYARHGRQPARPQPIQASLLALRAEPAGPSADFVPEGESPRAEDDRAASGAHSPPAAGLFGSYRYGLPAHYAPQAAVSGPTGAAPSTGESSTADVYGQAGTATRDYGQESTATRDYGQVGTASGTYGQAGTASEAYDQAGTATGDYDPASATTIPYGQAGITTAHYGQESAAAIATGATEGNTDSRAVPNTAMTSAPQAAYSAQLATRSAPDQGRAPAFPQRSAPARPLAGALRLSSLFGAHVRSHPAAHALPEGESFAAPEETHARSRESAQNALRPHALPGEVFVPVALPNAAVAASRPLHAPVLFAVDALLDDMASWLSLTAADGPLAADAQLLALLDELWSPALSDQTFAHYADQLLEAVRDAAQIYDAPAVRLLWEAKAVLVLVRRILSQPPEATLAAAKARVLQTLLGCADAGSVPPFAVGLLLHAAHALGLCASALLPAVAANTLSLMVTGHLPPFLEAGDSARRISAWRAALGSAGMLRPPEGMIDPENAAAALTSLFYGRGYAAHAPAAELPPGGVPYARLGGPASLALLDGGRAMAAVTHDLGDVLCEATFWALDHAHVVVSRGASSLAVSAEGASAREESSPVLRIPMRQCRPGSRVVPPMRMRRTPGRALVRDAGDSLVLGPAVRVLATLLALNMLLYAEERANLCDADWTAIFDCAAAIRAAPTPQAGAGACAKRHGSAAALVALQLRAWLLFEFLPRPEMVLALRRPADTVRTWRLVG